MAANIDELKQIQILTIMKELVELTKGCSLIWNEVSPGQFRTRAYSLEFVVSRNNRNIFSLDVLKNKKLYRTFNSSTQYEVDTLYKMIDALTADSKLDKYKRLGNFIGNIGSCRYFTEEVLSPITYDIVPASYGLGISGSGLYSQIRPAEPILLVPNRLTFGPTDHPWTGSVQDIDDPLDLAGHDGYGSAIRQVVPRSSSSASFGFAYVEFDLNNVPKLPPFNFFLRVAYCRENEDGILFNCDVVVNSSLVYAGSAYPMDYWQYFVSSPQFMLGIDKIESLVVRLSMYSNTASSNERALQISAVDIRIFGFEEVL
jgi:hypothetical protein